MQSPQEYLDITDRQADYDFISKEAFRTETGLRAISFMYDDHSSDKNSYDNILLLKDNIHYRLFSAAHQYLVFLKELGGAETYLQKLYQKNPHYISAFPMGNPFFDKVELELSSIFDNIVFQVSSVFDYLSHIICYIIFKNKSNTLYWTKLANSARGQNNDFNNIEMKKIVDEVDKRFVGRLYDYRSRLLHNKRDKHYFGGKTTLGNFDFHLRLNPSELSIKHFKLISENIKNEEKITLTYLSSWLIKQTFKEIEALLDILSVEIKKDSNFHKNLYFPKKGDNALLIVSVNPDTKHVEPMSDGLWKEYKEKASR